ncbi:phosphotransferase enzyme family protein [Colletotrichum asianum]
MAAEDTSERILRDIKAELASTPYSFGSARLLTGGTANFIYQARLNQPLPDGTSEVAIKHGEGFVRQSPDFKLTTSRCRIEESCLQYLAAFPPCTNSNVSVTTLKLFYFNRDTNTQVQEYQPTPLSLKLYAIEHFALLEPAIVRAQCLEIGLGIGQWLRQFHDWSNSPAQSNLREIALANKDMQSIKHWANYQQLPNAMKRHPTVFRGCGDIFNAIVGQSTEELIDQKSLQVIHGDFWTGNIIFQGVRWESRCMHLFVVDWEMFQVALTPLDLGQMIAELYQLKLYKNLDAGLWLIEGFTKGYGDVDDSFAFRTLLHVGVHLIGFGTTVPDWGDAEQVEKVAVAGREIVLGAWAKSRRWFDDHPLGCIFSSA